MAQFTVKSKSEGFKGSRLGIQFIHGVATFEDEKLIRLFEELGYTVEGKPEPKQAAKKKPATKKKATAKKKGE